MNFETSRVGPSRARPGRLFVRLLFVALLVAVPAGLWFRSPAGRDGWLDARVRWTRAVHGGDSARLVALFREGLTRSLDRSGVDTSLIRVEMPGAVDGKHRARYEVPLPEGFATSRGNAIVTREVARFGGQVTDGVEESSNRVLVTASIPGSAGAEFLLMGKDVPRGGARVALLVDRFGYRSLTESTALLEIGRGLSVAILPHTTGARDLADGCRAHGMEVLLNLPMEGLDYPRVDPGPGAILVDMAPGEIEKRVDRALDQIGGAKGVHTWLGELAVEDKDVMRAVLRKVAERHGYFVESTSSSFSVVQETAAEVGAAAIRIPNELDAPGVSADRIRRNLMALAGEAKERGVAVGLIHPFPATIVALREVLPEWRRQGVDLVPLSEVVTVPRE